MKHAVANCSHSNAIFYQITLAQVFNSVISPMLPDSDSVFWLVVVTPDRLHIILRQNPALINSTAT